MTNFLRWRKKTWAIGVWSAGMATWLLAGDFGTWSVSFMWLVGAAGLGLVWFMTQPLFRRGRGLRDGFFVRPSPGDWRVLNLHRRL